MMKPDDIYTVMLNKKFRSSFLNVLLILGVLGVLPFFVNSFFVHPAADDFIFANTSLQHGAWQAQINWYNAWTGRYFSTFLLSNSPLVYHWPFGYKLIPVFLLALLIFSLFLLLRSLFRGIFKTKTILIYSLTLLFIYLHRFPSTNWGLYWMTGAFTYQLGNISMLLLLWALTGIMRSPGRKQKTAFTFFAVAMVFVSVGCNEITMLLVNALLLTVFFVEYGTQKKVNRYVLILIIVAVALSVFVFVSPGKEARELTWDQSHQLLASVLATFRRTFSQVVFRLIYSPLLIFSVLAFPFFDRLGSYFVHREIKLFNVNPLIAVAWLLLLPAMFFPLHYSLGPYEPHAERITNLIFLFFILDWFWLEILLITYVKRTGRFSLPGKRTYVYALVMMLMFYGFFPVREHNRIRTAWADIISGRSYRFNHLMNERTLYLENSDCSSCVVPAIKVLPETIVYKWFYVTGKGSEKFWMNREIAKYYGKKSLKILDKRKSDHQKKNPEKRKKNHE
jgi:hypothetical protein